MGHGCVFKESPARDLRSFEKHKIDRKSGLNVLYKITCQKILLLKATPETNHANFHRSSFI